MPLLPSRERLLSIYHEYPKGFWTLVVVTFIDRLGGSLLFPFFALYITGRFNVGMTEVGVLFAAFSASSFVGSMLGGALTDHIGRRSMLIFSLLSTSISSVVMGLVDSLQAFTIFALLVGIFTDTGGPAYQAMVADLLPEEKRAQGYGIIRVAFNVAVVIGPAIGGFMASRSYLMLFISDAIISTIAAGVVIAAIRETKPVLEEGEKPGSISGSFAGYFQVFRDRVFILFIGVCILMGLVYMNMSSTLGVYLRDYQNTPEAMYGWILSLNAAMVVLFQFPITRRIEKKPPLVVMAAGTLLYGVGFTMYGIFSTYALFLLAMVIITIGEMLVAPVSQSLVASFAPESMRGRYMAIFGFSWGIPFAVGPILAGLIMDNMDARFLWYAAGLVGLLAALGFLGLRRQMKTAPSTE